MGHLSSLFPTSLFSLSFPPLSLSPTSLLPLVHPSSPSLPPLICLPPIFCLPPLFSLFHLSSLSFLTHSSNELVAVSFRQINHFRKIVLPDHKLLVCASFKK